MPSTQSLSRRLANFADIVGAAIDAAAATEARRQPAKRTLDALRIDAAAFARIRR